MKIFDITIPFSENTPVWEGEKGITITRTAEIGPKSEYNVSRCEFGVHSGTHVDAPFHVIEEGKTVEAIPLDQLVGRAQVVEIPAGVKEITAEVLNDLRLDWPIRKLILKTSNSGFWDAEQPKFRRDFVGIDTSASEFLVTQQVDLVGIDFFSVSSYNDLTKPHQLLLEAGAVIVENLDLRSIEPGDYNIFCLPLKIIGTDGAPARVILTQEVVPGTGSV